MKKSVAIIVALLVSVSLLLGLLGKLSLVETIVQAEEPKEAEPVVIKEKEEEIIDYSSVIELYNTNKAINDDYVGEVKFDSGLIDLPFVKAKSDYTKYRFYDNYARIITDYQNGCEGGVCSANDVYLRVDWATMSYNLGGSIFMDARNNLNDQNLIIYGHHYQKDLDIERKLYFTPLEKLLQEENYEENKYVEIELDHEIRRYELAYVYLYHQYVKYDQDNLQYYRVVFDKDYYGNEDNGYGDNYLKAVKENALYETGVEISNEDNFLTLQTCLENTSSAVEVLLFKEIDRIKIEG